MQLRTQQTKNTKLFCESILVWITKEHGFRFFPKVIANSLEFKYDSDNRITFPAYFRRYETIFTKKWEQWLDEEKSLCYFKYQVQWRTLNIRA